MDNKETTPKFKQYNTYLYKLISCCLLPITLADGSCLARLLPKGIFSLSNQLSYFSKNWGAHRNKTEFHRFHKLILPIFAIHIKK